MNNKLKKALSLIMIFVMAFQLLPVSAFAESLDSGDELGGDVYYSVVFHDAEGTPMETQMVAQGGVIEAVPEMEMKRTGEGVSYLFDGWYTQPDGAGTPVTAGTPVSGDMNVYPKYTEVKKVTVTVSYRMNTVDGEEIARDVGEYPEIEESVTFTVPASLEVRTAGNTKTMYPTVPSITFSPKDIARSGKTEETFYVVYEDEGEEVEVVYLCVDDDGKEVRKLEDAPTFVVGKSGEDIHPYLSVKEFSHAEFIRFKGYKNGKETDSLNFGDVDTVWACYKNTNVTLRYDSQGGSYVEPRIYAYGADAEVYTQGSTVLTCGLTEHKHSKSCYSKKGYLICGKTEHTHKASCYSTTLGEPVPTRVGYKFGGWYLDSACTQAAPKTINNMTTDIVVYAKWEAQDVDYSNVYMKQNNDGTYSYVTTKILQAKVDSSVSGDGTVIKDFSDGKYYHFSRATQEKVSSDASTVVYTYYDLNTYYLEFDLNTSSGKIKLNAPDGKTYTYQSSPKYTIKCRYGEDVSALWPSAGDFELPEDSTPFYGWRINGEGSDFVSKRFEVTAAMIDNTDNNSTTTYIAHWKKGDTVELHYLLQNADDNNYTDEERFRQSAVTASGFDPKEIFGFKNISASSKTISGVTHYYFKYDRNTYTIDYYYGSTKLASKKDIRFEKSINNSTYNFVPDKPSGVDSDATFIGWYDNKDCTGDPYVFNKMPGTNLVLYAKFQNPARTVTYVFNNGENNRTVEVEKGTLLKNATSKIEVPVWEGHILVGWFKDKECTVPCDDEMPINSNLTVYAKWDQIDYSYVVRYLEEGTDKVLSPEITIDKNDDGQTTLRKGDRVTRSALTLYGYRPDAPSKSLTILDDNTKNVITFYYSKRTETTYKVEYHVCIGDTEITVGSTDGTADEKKTQIVHMAPATQTYEGETYYVTDNPQTLVLSSNSELNILIFRYYPYTKGVLNVVFIDEDGSSLSGGAFDVSGINTNTKIGRTYFLSSFVSDYASKNVDGYEFVELRDTGGKVIQGKGQNEPLLTCTPDNTLTVVYRAKRYEVTYKYTGFVPSDATKLPDKEEYKIGDTVKVAPAATANGYIFSGWSKTGSFKMPGENVEITGSWTAATDTAYKVEHYKQTAIDSEDYKLADTENKTGTTGQQTAAVAKSYAGYDAQSFAQLTIAGDGTTVVKIYYDINGYDYTVKYLLNGTDVPVRAETTGTKKISETEKVSPESVPGYTPVSNTEAEISKNNREIVFYYYKDITLTANSSTVDYDGKEHKVSGFEVSKTDIVSGYTPDFSGITVGAKGTDSGKYPAKFAAGTKGSVDKTGKYIVSDAVDGELVILPSKVILSVSGTDYEGTYDGQSHGVPAVATITEGTTYTYYLNGSETGSSEFPTIKDVGEIHVKVVAENKNYASGTAEYTLKVNPKTVIVTAKSDSKVYDGEPLTNSGYDVDVTGIIVSATVTGSQTTVGSSANKASDAKFAAGENADNYSVKYVDGLLTVTESKAEITVTTTGGEFEYDGAAHGATVSVSALPKGYTLETATSDDTATHVAEGEVTATCDTLVIRNAVGADVTKELNIKYVDGKIKITPATLTVVTPSDSKVYDGKPLTAEGTITGFVNNETATFKTTGSQTAVGHSENSYTLAFDKTAAESDYTVSKTLGTLTVTESKEEIVVTTTGGEFEYDGAAHGATVSVSTLPEGYTLETATSDDTATHVAEGEVTATCDTLVIRNAAGADVTKEMNIKYVDGKIKITPATLTVVTPSASKTYDGTALTAEGSITGFKNNETATFKTTGSQTAVGYSENGYTLKFDKTATESDYTVSETLGTLTVTEFAEEITVTTTGGEFEYDGKAHGATVSVSTLPKGYTLETATSDDTATHVAEGEVTATCDTLVIRNAAGADVTKELNIKYVDGKIKITPATLTVVTPSASKTYDGTALTAEGSITGFKNSETATFKTTGSQTAVGYSENGYTLKFDKTATESDYTVSKTLGTLTVTESKEEIVVTTTGGEFEYDGAAHGATVSVSTLPEGYTLETATSDDTATHVAEGEVTATCDTLVIRNAAGADVTKELNIKYVDGTIKITPAKLTVNTPSDSKVYDGKPLTAEGTITGFVNNETATFKTTGSQTAVGHSENSYALAFDKTAAESDYTVSKTIGTLTVSESRAEIVVTTTGGEFEYDGQTHGATVSVSTLPEGYTLETATSDDTATNVADGEVAATCDTLVIKNAQGIDVTKELNIKYVDGKIKIVPTAIEITVDSTSKIYGNADPEFTGNITSGKLVEADDLGEITYKRTNSAEDAGKYADVLTAEYTENGNYTVTVIKGDFEITKKTIKVTVDDIEKTYGEADPEYTGTVEGTVPGDEPTIVYKRTDGDGDHKDDPAGTKTDVITAETDDPNYEIEVVPGDVKVSKKAAVITVNDASKTYGDEDPAFTGKVEGLVNKDDLGEITYKRTNSDENAGKYTDVLSAEYTENSNYEVTIVKGDFEITQKTIKITVDDIEKTYGDADPEYTGTVEGTVPGDEPTIVYKRTDGDGDHKDDPAGTKTDVITAETTDPNYKVEVVPGDVKVSKKEAVITVNDASKTYGDEDPAFSGKVEGLVNEGDLGEITYKRTNSAEDAGKYTDVLTAEYTENGNYTVTVIKGDFEITKKTIKVTVDDIEKTYGEADPEYTGTVEGTVPGDEPTIVYKRTDGDGDHKDDPAGTKTDVITAETDDPNYEIEVVPGDVKVSKKEAVITVNDASKTYGDEDPAFSGKVEGLVNKDDLGEITYKRTNSAEDAGKYTDVLSAEYTENSNYEVTIVKGDFEITQKTIKVTVDDIEKTYGDADPEYTGTVEGTVPGDEPAIVYKRTDGDGDHKDDPAGTKTDVITAETTDPNYKVEVVPGDVKVSKKEAVITVNDASKTYGDEDPAFSGKVEGLVNEGDLGEITYKRTNSAEDAGKYTDVLTAEYTENGNYTVTVINGDFEITKKTIKVTVNDIEKTYGDADPEYTGKVEGTVPGDEPTIVYKRTDGDGDHKDDPAGTKADVITAETDDPNYEIEVVPGDVKVSKKEAVITVNDASKTYGDEDPAFSGKVEGLVNKDDLGEITYKRTNSDENAGKYADVLSAEYTENSNYEVTIVKGDFEIGKKTITVTVDDITKTYGDPDPKYTGTVEGTVPGDDPAIVYKRTDGDGDHKDDHAGTKADVITAETTNPNYEIEVVPGDVNVEKKVITVTVDDIEKIYGDADPTEYTGKVEGTVPGDNPVIVYKRTDGGGDHKDDPAGTKTDIISAETDDPDYEIEVVPGSVKVDKRPITITVDPASKTYGDKDPEFTGKVTSGDLANDDEIRYFRTNKDEEANEYPEVLSAEIKNGNDNYEVTVIPGDFTINKAPVVIKYVVDGEVVEEIELMPGDPIPTHPGDIDWDPSNAKVVPDGSGGGTIEIIGKQNYYLTIYYEKADGTQVKPSVTEKYHAGDRYSIPSPALAGYTPRIEVVTGTMPASNRTVTVTYDANPVPPREPTQKYKVTIHYIFDDGTKAQDDYVMEVESGEEFYRASPKIEGYTPNYEYTYRKKVDKDLEYTIVYSKDEPGKKYGEVVDNGNGGYTIEAIAEEEVPLALRDDHKDCLLHFLLVVLTFIVQLVYVDKRKKYQQEIFELQEKILRAEQ